jgi:uncharacterized phage-associated protein
MGTADVNMPHDGRAVANFVLDKCAERGAEVSNLSLQKIVDPRQADFFDHDSLAHPDRNTLSQA